MDLNIKKYFSEKWNIQKKRDEFVLREIYKLPKFARLLDAGAGSQRYRKFCNELLYKSQDFCQYKVDHKTTLSGLGMGGENGYEYGATDIVSDIWKIPAEDNSFDCILCTEVFEHIPYPNETMFEFFRLLSPGGKLILTLPSNCLRHMDPFFFYTGFSDRWINEIGEAAGFHEIYIESIGDYYAWMKIEIGRTFSKCNFVSKLMLLPALIYFSFKKSTIESTNTLCAGYHIVAFKK